MPVTVNGWAIHLDTLVQYIRRRSQFVPPIAIANHRDRIAAARNIVLRPNQSPQKRPYAKHAKVSAGHKHDGPGNRLAGESDIARERAEACYDSRFAVLLQFPKGAPIEDVVHAPGVVVPASAVLQVAG
jgi:hypothetical protein